MVSTAEWPSTPAPESYLLVMTATIIPAANAGVRRAEPQLRLDDYMQALRYWLSYLHPAASRILLLENSGADLSELRAIVANENPLNKSVEILSVPGNHIPEGTNYGYTEMQMLDEGLPALNAATHTYFLVTGSEKAAALDHVLQPAADMHAYPAAGIRTADDGPVWWVDREAAALYRPRS